jgi:alkylation response protein AidB-like acyl-CoA dehydrogenase
MTGETALFRPPESALRGEVEALFGTAEMARALDEVHAGGRDPRPVYRVLGSHGLLAPHWPVEAGGRGGSHVDAGAVVEQLVVHEVPDLAYMISVFTVGNLLLHAGTAQQRARLLPALANGDQLACVLFTEPEAGSDLAAVRTVARPAGDGALLVTGRKVHSLFSAVAGYGLCLARTAERASRYEGLTLGLVSMRAPGVTVRSRPALGPDDFHEVTLDGVLLGAQDVVGRRDGAWPVLMKALVYERCGLEYYAKAAHWYALLAATRPVDGGSPMDGGTTVARFAAQVRAAGLLSYGVLAGLDNGTAEATDAAIAKLYASELAAEIAACVPAAVGHPGRPQEPPWPGLVRAFGEAPGLRVSGGTSEMMLESIASTLYGG